LAQEMLEWTACPLEIEYDMPWDCAENCANVHGTSKCWLKWAQNEAQEQT